MHCSNAANTGPLAGVKVVEMGHLIAGPFCGQLMGDMGAEVIKIEPPGCGDPMRTWGRGEHPLWWEVISRNKLSVSADMRLREGQALARRLIAAADILIENFRPGTLEKWGLAPENLHRDNPGLIIVRVSGYGQTGPYSERAGFGGIGEAMGGWRYIVGEPDRPPSRMGISIGDTLAGTFGCLGALAALRYRDSSGIGQVVDSSLYESVLQVMESLIPEYSVLGHTRERSGSTLPGIAPSGVYRCRDGEYLIGANQDSVFARLCQAMGQTALTQDQRFRDHVQRGQHQKELDQIVEAWTQQHTVAEVEQWLIEAGVPAGRMYRAQEMLADPHFEARESIVDVPHPRWGTLKMQNVFPKLSVTPGRVRTIAPQQVGEHNRAIYGGRFGLTDSELDDLAARGVI
jgi:crotonobetainyl-CoA:carnitine CoA-transferase CaiB-like acyl-CoA transferase